MTADYIKSLVTAATKPHMRPRQLTIPGPYPKLANPMSGVSVNWFTEKDNQVLTATCSQPSHFWVEGVEQEARSSITTIIFLTLIQWLVCLTIPKLRTKSTSAYIHISVQYTPICSICCLVHSDVIETLVHTYMYIQCTCYILHVL